MLKKIIRRSIYFSLFMIFIFVGYLIGKSPSEITSFNSHELRVVKNSMNDYLQRKMDIDGIGGALVLSIKPVEVSKKNGHCDMVSGNSFQDNPDLFNYMITVQKYSFFKVPLGKIYFTCGGNGYSKRKP